MYGGSKTIRDLLIYILWKYGVYTTQKIGNLFQITYSAVSQNVASFRNSIKKDNKLEKLHYKIKSQLKMWHHCFSGTGLSTGYADIRQEPIKNDHKFKITKRVTAAGASAEM